MEKVNEKNGINSESIDTSLSNNNLQNKKENIKVISLDEIVAQEKIPIILLPDVGTNRNLNKNELCEKIDKQLQNDVDVLSIDISFLEAH